MSASQNCKCVPEAMGHNLDSCNQLSVMVSYSKGLTVKCQVYSLNVVHKYLLLVLAEDSIPVCLITLYTHYFIYILCLHLILIICTFKSYNWCGNIFGFHAIFLPIYSKLG